VSNYPATDPTIRFPPADRRDYDQPVEWLETGIVPRQPETRRERDNTLIAILLTGGLLLIYMAKAGAYSEYRAQPPLAEPAPPAITIVDNSWNMCGICTDAAPHFVIQQP
jgi:hypothetical protein